MLGGANETKYVSSSQFAIKEALGPMDANPLRFNLEANLVFSTKYMYTYTTGCHVWKPVNTVAAKCVLYRFVKMHVDLQG